MDCRKRGIYAQSVFPHRIPAHRNSKLRKKKKKRQIRDSKERIITEKNKVGTKDRSPEGLSIAEVT